MTVALILAAKGRDVVTIDPAATLAEATRLLAEKRIGAALILGADRRLVGIISERDIVRALAAGGAAALEEPVSKMMTRKVETCNEGETVASIMERMTAGKFRHMPVSIRAGSPAWCRSATSSNTGFTKWKPESGAMREYIMTA